MEKKLSHLDEDGRARMVDVSAKPRVLRTAKATGHIRLAPETIALISEKRVPKGDVIAAARIAGIMAAKRTSDLIPLCHNIEIEHVAVDLVLDAEGVAIEASCSCTDKTGIEMEALTAVSVAALAVWDMCKAVDKGMRIHDIRLLEKTKEEVQ